MTDQVSQLISNMARASAQAGTTSSAARKMAGRYRSYLFLFSVSMAHELTHLFVAYLAKGNDAERCFTPRSVSYANYQQPIGDLGIMGGESGRFLEARLWGGAMEFYQDVKDDNEQVNRPIARSMDFAADIHLDRDSFHILQ